MAVNARVEGFPAAAAGRADREAVDSDLADLQVVEEPAAVGVPAVAVPAVRLSDKRSCNRARAAADAVVVAVVAAPAAGVEAIRVTRPSIRST